MKRIVIAVMLSILGPGLGQLYNKDARKGILLLIVSALLFFSPLFLVFSKIGTKISSSEPLNPEKVQAAAMEIVQSNNYTFNMLSFAFLGVWAYAITQAYFRAKEISDSEKPDEEGTEPPEDN